MAQSFEPAFSIAELVEHPENPRRGDESAIEASMEAHGFYGAVLAQTSTRRIIAGNHRTRVARRRGETTVPVLFLDVDDDQARRLMLVDNRTQDLAAYDERALARLLEDLLESTGDLIGAGYDPDDLAQLLARLEPDGPDAFAELDPDALVVEYRCPSCGYEWSGRAVPAGSRTTVEA
jgi:ParB-like chromosome segregation protein Spo0J